MMENTDEKLLQFKKLMAESNWNAIFAMEGLKSSFIEKHAQTKEHWDIITEHQYLDEDFMRRNEKNINFSIAAISQKLSETFIKDYADKWEDSETVSALILSQDISDNYLLNNPDIFKFKETWGDEVLSALAFSNFKEETVKRCKEIVNQAKRDRMRMAGPVSEIYQTIEQKLLESDNKAAWEKVNQLIETATSDQAKLATNLDRLLRDNLIMMYDMRIYDPAIDEGAPSDDDLDMTEDYISAHLEELSEYDHLINIAEMGKLSERFILENKDLFHIDTEAGSMFAKILIERQNISVEARKELLNTASDAKIRRLKKSCETFNAAYDKICYALLDEELFKAWNRVDQIIRSSTENDPWYATHLIALIESLSDCFDELDSKPGLESRKQATEAA